MWISTVTVGIVLPLLLIKKKKIIRNENEFQKPPAGGGTHGLTQNSPELARLHFHFRPINRGKGGEHSAMASIIQKIHVLLIK